MAGPADSMKRALQHWSEQQAGAECVDAVIRVTTYGAEVVLTNGSSRTFPQAELTEPAVEAGIRWSREQGAVTLRVRR